MISSFNKFYTIYQEIHNQVTVWIENHYPNSNYGTIDSIVPEKNRIVANTTKLGAIEVPKHIIVLSHLIGDVEITVLDGVAFVTYEPELIGVNINDLDT